MASSDNINHIDAELMEDEAALNYNGIFMLFGQINTISIAPACRWIIKNSLKKNPTKDMRLFITSEGGDIPEAFALIDIMRGSKFTMSTVGLGEVCSAGLMIFMAGDKGSRILTPNSFVMSHQYSLNSGGKEHELLASRKATDIMSRMIINHYMKCTGMTEKKVRDILLPPEDVFLTPKEAVKYGICDKVKELEYT